MSVRLKAIKRLADSLAKGAERDAFKADEAKTEAEHRLADAKVARLQAQEELSKIEAVQAVVSD
jgi:hypothetical protein